MPAMTELPVAPNRNDPDTFADRADALVAALPGFVNEANALAEDVTAKSAVCTSAAQAVAVTGWVSGTTYTQGLNVWDPVTLLTYRRKVTGAGTTRPALDPTNWALLTGFGDADLGSAQTFTGQKTFSQPIVGSVTGNAATASACTGNAATVSTVTTAQVAAAMAGVAAGGVGSYTFAARMTDAVFGQVVAGSSLNPTSAVYAQKIEGNLQVQFDVGSALSGSWMCMGRQDANVDVLNQQSLFGATLYLRVA